MLIFFIVIIIIIIIIIIILIELSYFLTIWIALYFEFFWETVNK